MTTGVTSWHSYASGAPTEVKQRSGNKYVRCQIRSAHFTPRFDLMDVRVAGPPLYHPILPRSDNLLVLVVCMICSGQVENEILKNEQEKDKTCALAQPYAPGKLCP